MNQSGRHNVADISRLCRAFMARYSSVPAGADPSADQVIAGLIDEVDALPIPGNSLVYMAAMIKAMHNRLVRVVRDHPNGGTPMSLGDIESQMLADGSGSPALVADCFAVITETARTPRDQRRLDRVVSEAGERWGAAANLTLAFVYVGIARGVVDIDPTVHSITGLLAEVSLDEERDLMRNDEP